PQRLYLPPIMDPVYGYEAVNVEAQSRDPSSLLNWMKRKLAVRKAHKVFGRGSLQFLYPGNTKILAYIRESEQETILCVANLARSAQPVELDLSRYKGRVPVEMMGHTPFPPIGDLPYLLTLSGYGFYWFELATEAEAPPWHKEVLPRAELPVLVLFEGWRSFFPDQVERTRRAMAEKLHRQLEHEVLPGFLAAQRWFAAKGERIARVELFKSVEWSQDKGSWLLARVRVHLDGTKAQTYFLPLAIAWEKKGGEEHMRQAAACTLAKVRQRARVGILCDALADPAFCQALVEAMGQGVELPFGKGRFKFSATAAFVRLVGDTSLQEMRPPMVAGSNTAVILGDQLFLKVYRHLQEGLSPEVELGHFLTEISPFAHVVPLAGALEYQDVEGNRFALGLLQGYVANQGDAWSYTLDYLKRFLEAARLKPLEEMMAQAEELHAVHLLMMHTLGRRTGELQQALSRRTGDPAFDPEPISAEDLSYWSEQIRDEAVRTLDLVQRYQERLPASLGTEIERLLSLRRAIENRISDLTPLDLEAFKTRHHGDYHLGQVLLVENDFIIVDFEGEPARPLHERRAKHSPLRDVAGMLRSFDYAASVAVQYCALERPEDRMLLEPHARAWERLARAAFLAGYREGVEGCPSYPANPDHSDRLIRLFMLEKALYELRYELDNRPDWIGVPLLGLLRLLGAEADQANGTRSLSP
ncbi:MAG: putative maltokinase, partial [Acidobacteria bacterium]|nr:putative maltokinase [Acidobacteriota bacterium]